MLLEVNVQFLLDNYKAKISKVELVIELFKHERKGTVKKKDLND